MNGQEPLSVFRRPEPAPEPKRPVLSRARRLTLSRALAAVSAAVLLAIIAMDLVSPTPARSSVTQTPPAKSSWIEVTRTNGAFEIVSPHLGALEQTYLVRHHRTGNGRQDVLTYGAASNMGGAFIRISIYRPGTEGAIPIDPLEAIASVASDARLEAELSGPSSSVVTKFGELATAGMQVANGNRKRNCLAAAGKFDEPTLGIVVWYCNPGEEIVAAGRVACLMDRLSLALSGGDEKLIDFFARAERNRSFCDAKNTLYGHAPRTPDWIDTRARPVLRGKFTAR